MRKAVYERLESSFAELHGSQGASTKAWLHLKKVCSGIATAWPEDKTVGALVAKVKEQHDNVDLAERMAALSEACKPLTQLKEGAHIPHSSLEKFEAAWGQFYPDSVALSALQNRL